MGGCSGLKGFVVWWFLLGLKLIFAPISFEPSSRPLVASRGKDQLLIMMMMMITMMMMMMMKMRLQGSVRADKVTTCLAGANFEFNLALV